MKWAIAAAILAVALPAAAQSPPAPRMSVSGGIVWSGGYAIGDAAGEYRTNAGGATPPPFTLFSAASDVRHATGAELRLGYDLTRAFTVEGGVSISSPNIAVAIGADAESTPQTLEGEELQQYVFDAAVVWRPSTRERWGLSPFVIAGAGYLRQLHEEQTLVESGRLVYFGGGVRRWIRRPSARRPAFGVSGTVRANIRSGGVDFDNATRVFPTLALGVFLQL